MDDFTRLVEICKKAGEPFQLVVKCANNSGYEVSLKSKYASNAYAVDYGETPLQALENVMRQRKINFEEEVK